MSPRGGAGMRSRSGAKRSSGDVGIVAAGFDLWSVLGDQGSQRIVGALVLAVIQPTAAVRATVAEHFTVP